MEDRDSVVLVTGAAGGIGAAICERIEAAGLQCVATDVGAPDRPSAWCLPLDVTDPRDWTTVVEAVLERFARLDGLVNVAGVVARGNLHEISDDAWHHVISVNQTGTFYGMRAVARPMQQAGRGSIVNISSTAGLTGFAGSIPYVASKFAVTGMTRAAALELGDFGVRVNSVHPGSIEAPMARRLGPRLPINRFGRPEEIAELVHFLLSDASSYCTGSQFVSDGGQTAGLLRD